jgi:hypothetical protein
LKCPRAKSANHCLTELFSIYQNKHWTIRRWDNHIVVPSSNHIKLKIDWFKIISMWQLRSVLDWTFVMWRCLKGFWFDVRGPFWWLFSFIFRNTGINIQPRTLLSSIILFGNRIASDFPTYSQLGTVSSHSCHLNVTTCLWKWMWQVCPYFKR